MAEGQWRISLFGRLQAQREPQTLLQFSARRIGALLACLVLRAPHSVNREELLALLWPDGEPDACRNRLRALLSNLRGGLEPSAMDAGSVLIADRTTVQIKPSAFTSDYHDFLQALQTANTSPDAVETIAVLESTLALYQGELLEGYYDDWILTERSRLNDLRYRALRELVRRLAQSNLPERAVEYARQAVAAEPLDEEAHCDLMRLYDQIGQPSAGLRQFEQLKRLLHEEMHAQPSEQTRRLASEIEAKLGHGVSQTKRIVRPMMLRASERAAQQPKRAVDLPVRLTRFFGREEEMALLCSLLSTVGSTRLVSLVGTGGTGKTRLAIEAAEQLSGEYSGRIYFVSLADVLDPNEVGRAVAGALRLSASPGMDPLSQAMVALNQAPALLILDNMEQITPDAGPQVEWMLSEVASLRCLVTSRRSLGIEGEREIALGPLPLPLRGVGFDELEAYSGVALFVDRARSVRSDFALTASNAADVIEICQELEGLPLAIELAAARTRVMTPGEMREQTGRRMQWLVDMRGGKVERHRSLRATLEWSYRLLSPRERRYFNALAVFVNGFSAEAAGAVALGEGAETLQSLGMLEPLCDASMLTTTQTSEGRTRFGMLEMLREYGLERLEESGEEAVIRSRHLAYYSEFVRKQMDASFRWNPGELAGFTVEDANLRAALEFGLRSEGSEEERGHVLELSSRLCGYWEVQGRLSEGSVYLRRVLLLPGTTERQAARVNALRGAGVLSGLLGDHDEARSLLEAGLSEAKVFAGPRSVAGVVSSLGGVAFALGDYPEARAQYEEALEVYREIADWGGIASSLAELGNVAFFVGDQREARERLEEALELYRQSDDTQGTASVLLRLGNVLRNQNDYAEGRIRLDEAMTLFQDVGNRQGIGSSLIGLGLVALMQQDMQHDYTEAQTCFTEALDIFREIGHLRGVAMCLIYSGAVACRVADYVESHACITEALEICRKTGDRRNMTACLHELGNLAWKQDDDREAYTRWIEALEIDREIGNRFGIAMNLCDLGRLEIKRGDTEEARECLSEALEITRETGVPTMIADTLELHARLAQSQGQSVRAARLASAAMSIRKAVGNSSSNAAYEQRQEEFLAQIRAALGETAFAYAWKASEALSREEAIAEALNEGPGPVTVQESL